MEEKDIVHIIEHEHGDFTLDSSKSDLYRLGLLPLRCHTCGMIPPQKMIRLQQKEIGRE